MNSGRGVEIWLAAISRRMALEAEKARREFYRLPSRNALDEDHRQDYQFRPTQLPKQATRQEL